MYQPYRDPARAFARRLLLGCVLLAAVSLLLGLGAWLKSFTVSPPPPPKARPAVTVTVTVTSAVPAGPSGRSPDEDRPVALPRGTDGAAQTACSALVQAEVLRRKGRRAEAAVRGKAAQEAALASAVPALRTLKGRPAKEVTARLGAWCPRHFPGLSPKPFPSSPLPAPLRSGARRTATASPACSSSDSYARGLDPGRPDFGDQDPNDPRCVRH
ncbi:hypothetical protein [Actinocorallia aurantiaca]|uniref:Uncharacterized protein n=1 Tax=Actinocorallia aurantiaca TaxID=46204 RepID=A0ABN3U0M6_9ACTN